MYSHEALCGLRADAMAEWPRVALASRQDSQRVSHMNTV